MAKKITIEEYEKSKKDSLKPEQKNKLLLPLIIMIVLFVCSIICIVLLLFITYNSSTSNKRLTNKLLSSEELAESYKEDIDRLTGDKDVDYIEDGKDATVSYNTVDFAFQNNTENDIKLFTSCDDKNVYASINKIENQ